MKLELFGFLHFTAKNIHGKNNAMDIRCKHGTIQFVFARELMMLRIKHAYLAEH